LPWKRLVAWALPAVNKCGFRNSLAPVDLQAMIWPAVFRVIALRKIQHIQLQDLATVLFVTFTCDVDHSLSIRWLLS